MKNIISQTEKLAQCHFKEFGFNQEQINALITQGKKDLLNELTKLKHLVENTDNVSLEKINDALHALKGLFFQLGNHEIAEKFNEIKSNDEREVILKEILELFQNDL